MLGLNLLERLSETDHARAHDHKPDRCVFNSIIELTGIFKGINPVDIFGSPLHFGLFPEPLV
jgi:hypothetical protein